MVADPTPTLEQGADSMKKILGAAIAAVGLAATPAGASSDIVATAQSAGQFNTLVAAVQAAGLVETLQGPGPFTVFAPTDAAFAALPAGTLDSLLKPENKGQLTQILTYHVIPGRVTSGDIQGKALEVATVQGSTLKVDASGGNGVMVNEARVVTPDVMASNGVIHVIDKVVLPN